MTLQEAKTIIEAALSGDGPEGTDPLSEILLAIIEAVEAVQP